MVGAERIVLGRALGPHGLRGEIRIRYFGDGPANILRQSVVWLGEEENDSGAKRFEVARSGTGRAGEVRLALVGIEEREAAEELEGMLLLGSKGALEPLEDGEFYWHQLIGCRVETETGRNIGTIQEIWETGAHDVLVVESEDGVQRLISAAREIATEIDPEARRVVIATQPGMLETDES